MSMVSGHEQRGEGTGAGHRKAFTNVTLLGKWFISNICQSTFCLDRALPKYKRPPNSMEGPPCDWRPKRLAALHSFASELQNTSRELKRLADLCFGCEERDAL